MRYLIKKLDIPAEFYKRYSEAEYRVNSFDFAYRCVNCGADLYGKFYYPVYASSESIWEAKLALEKLESYGKEHYQKEFATRKRRLSHLQSLYDDTCGLRKNARAACEKAMLKNCPICGAELKKEPDLSFSNIEDGPFSDGTLHTKRFCEEINQELSARYPLTYDKTRYRFPPHAESVLDIIDIICTHKDCTEANNAANSYLESCNQPVLIATDNKADMVKNDVELLKKYIILLIQQENNIYSLKQQLTELYHRRLVNGRSIIQETNGPAYKLRMQLRDLDAVHQEAWKAIEEAKQYRPSVSVDYPKEPETPILGTPGLFNKKRVLAENEMLMAKYQAALAVYEKKVQLCNEEKARLIAEKRAAVLAEAQEKARVAKAVLDQAEAETNRKIKDLKEHPVPAKAVKEMLDNEIVETEELLKKTFASRNELYSYNIIFGKYRNVVALSSFYEYLMAGRCTSLEGSDGAYNIYENEIRLNQVISQLDTILVSLEEIKQNQYMIYQELRTINTTLNHLNSTMDKALTAIQGIETKATSMNELMYQISKNSSVIAHNTAVSAYYSKINAELTNALGFMVALK